jgi:NADP-dependent 3-hydroxy acid dehydrogenase YdfG
VLVARREEQLKAVADRAVSHGASDAYVVVGDVTKEDDCKTVIDAAIQKYGRCKLIPSSATPLFELCGKKKN